MGDLGKHYVRISNISTPSECSGSSFSQTACGFVLEFEDIILEKAINVSTSSSVWPSTELYTYVNNDLYNMFPTDLKNVVIDTKVVSSYGYGASANAVTNDKLYLLAPKEIYSDLNTKLDIAFDLTRQLDYYKNEGVTTSSYSKVIKMYNSTATWWWLRPAYSISNSNFYYVERNGRDNYYDASSAYGVSPAFRIG